MTDWRQSSVVEREPDRVSVLGSSTVHACRLRCFLKTCVTGLPLSSFLHGSRA